MVTYGTSPAHSSPRARLNSSILIMMKASASSGIRLRTSSARPARSTTVATCALARRSRTGFITKWVTLTGELLPTNPLYSLCPFLFIYNSHFSVPNQTSPVTQGDYPALETLAKNAVKEKQPFERLVVSKPDLLEMFKHNPYKVHIINDKIPDGTSTTVYRCGPLIDLCLGPHVPNTGRIKAFLVTKVRLYELCGHLVLHGV